MSELPADKTIQVLVHHVVASKSLDQQVQQQPTRQAHDDAWRRAIVLSLCVVLWYSGTVQFNMATKKAVSDPRQAPEVLALAMFGGCTMFNFLWSATGLWNAPQLCHYKMLLSRGGVGLTCLITAMGALGSWSGLAILFHGSIHIVQVLRCVAPAISCALMVLIMGSGVRMGPVICLAVAVGGAVMAVYNVPSYTWQTSVLGLLMNFCLCLRNVCTKMAVARCDGCAAAAAQAPSITVSALAASNVLGLIVSLAFCAIKVFRTTDSPETALGLLLASSMNANTLHVAMSSFIYNSASQIILNECPILVHSMLDLLKRIVVIGFVLIIGKCGAS